jgi:hypothetical protein
MQNRTQDMTVGSKVLCRLRVGGDGLCDLSLLLCGMGTALEPKLVMSRIPQGWLHSVTCQCSRRSLSSGNELSLAEDFPMGARKDEGIKSERQDCRTRQGWRLEGGG